MCYAQTTNGSHLTTEKQHNRRLRWNYYDTYCFIMFSYESHVVSHAVVVSSTYFIFQHTHIIILYCVCVRLIDLFAYAYTLYIYGSIRTIRSTHCMFECSVHNIYIYGRARAFASSNYRVARPSHDIPFRVRGVQSFVSRCAHTQPLYYNIVLCVHYNVTYRFEVILYHNVHALYTLRCIGASVRKG